MDSEEFRKWSHIAAEWGAGYRETLRDRPVRARTQPGAIAAQVAPSLPEAAGRIYLIQTLVDGRVAIRFQAGQFETTQADVDAAFDAIIDAAASID